MADPEGGHAAFILFDRRSERLGGHYTRFKTFLTNLNNAAENAYIVEERGDVSSASKAFAQDLCKYGELLQHNGKAMMSRGTRLIAAIEKRERASLKVPSQFDDTENNDDDNDEPTASSSKEPAKKKSRMYGPFTAEEAQQKGIKQIDLYVCFVCQKTFKYLAKLNDHLRIHTDEKLLCTDCDYEFNTEQMYKLHMKAHQEGPYKCEECGIDFPLKSSLNNHRRVVHAAPEDVYVCEVCQKEMTDKYRFDEHVEFGHRTNKTVPCHECDPVSYHQSPSAVRSHKSKFHGKAPDQKGNQGRGRSVPRTRSQSNKDEENDGPPVGKGKGKGKTSGKKKAE